jgi:hypothetical protein
MNASVFDTLIGFMVSDVIITLTAIISNNHGQQQIGIY